MEKIREMNIDHKNRELDLEMLDKVSGGTDGASEAKCPVCKQSFPIRQIKDHLRIVHGK